MSDADIYRRKADELLRQATETTDLGERSRLISEAVRWHTMASEASGIAAGPEDWPIAQEDDPSEPEAS